MSIVCVKGLKIKPYKATLVPFIRRRELAKLIKKMYLLDHRKCGVKYLEISLEPFRKAQTLCKDMQKAFRKIM